MSNSKAGPGAMANFGRKLVQGLHSVAGIGFTNVQHSNSDGQPLQETLQDVIEAMKANGSEVSPQQVRGFLARHCKMLRPLDKRHILQHVEGIPAGIELGWVQYTHSRGATFSLGIFTDNMHFAQIALADDRGRVFMGEQADMDTAGMEPVFLFGKERNIRIPDGRRFGKEEGNTEPRLVDAIQGGIIGQDGNEHMFWLASWLKRDNRYTLEQLRKNLPASMRHDLEYRDAIATAFFYAYMLPRISGSLMGFGAGNIFRRLNREAPMGAIRRSVRDSLQAHAEGMRTSGLEDYFVDLMKEAGALDTISGLEPVHGAEPMHLYASSYSGAYILSWENGMELSAALRALRIEGNLNRFATVSSWLERNARLGIYPMEDSVTRVQAAQLDRALLDNPAISALQMEDEFSRDYIPGRDTGRQAAKLLMQRAKQVSDSVAAQNPDPLMKQGVSHRNGKSEWVYRQSFSRLLRSLRLPFRFDVEFRSNLKQGCVAIAFTSAGRSMMPSSCFDARRNGWVEVTEAQRSEMSADYNLRVGMILAALAFGADDSVRSVSLHIDSLGLEEALAQQDSAITQMMAQALAAFEHARTTGAAVTGSKGDPKDGDIHGDPKNMIAREQAGNSDQQIPSTGVVLPASDSTDIEHATDTPVASGSFADDEEQAVDQEFADLMQGIDFDSMAFAAPVGENTDDAEHQLNEGDSSGDQDVSSVGQDPLSALKHNPTVRTLVTVTFTREVFLTYLRQYGFENPKNFYRFFDATMEEGRDGGLQPVSGKFNMRDEQFAPLGSQDEPELEDVDFNEETAAILGADHVTGLSIQRADLLERAMSDFRRLSANQELGSASKARKAMDVVQLIDDPELSQLAPHITSALIDDKAVPDLHFDLSEQLDRDRIKARDTLFSSDVSGAFEIEQDAVAKMDALFASSKNQHAVPRYFNSYAERVVYNRLFATPGEHTLLIPDNLFYAHLELADLMSQFKQTSQALQHLNAMVSYAPAYPLSHLKLAVQLAVGEDWSGARAATLNALQVALDRSDAAFAYYRFAYAAWMRDEFAVAAGAYIMAEHISPGRISMLKNELEELTARADSQCIAVPKNYRDACIVLREEGLPVWPHTKVATIVRQAARVLVDAGLFVPARTLSVAAARMNDDESNGLDMVEVQFLQSLNA